MPRLAVIDAAAVDGRRRLVLVRRDNVEHLLMIGGPSDIVVEPNIVRAPGRDQIPQRPSPGNEPSLPRLPPLAETGWTESDGPRSDSLDHPEEMPEPARPVLRPPFPDPARRPAAPERRNDPLAGFTPEPMSRTDIRGTRPARSEPTMPPRPSVRPAEPASTSPPRPVERPTFPPPPPPSPPASPPPASNADQNLAEMAQRLEAALRRPANDGKPAAVAPPVVPEPPPRPRTVESSAAPASRSEPPVAAAPVPTPGSKSGFEHLEDEMASLLGRPKSPS
jgi:hypothetical protein